MAEPVAEPELEHDQASTNEQLNVMLLKNFRLKRREICATLCETFFPILLIALLLVLSFIPSITKEKAVDYMSGNVDDPVDVLYQTLCYNSNSAYIAEEASFASLSACDDQAVCFRNPDGSNKSACLQRSAFPPGASGNLEGQAAGILGVLMGKLFSSRALNRSRVRDLDGYWMLRGLQNFFGNGGGGGPGNVYSWEAREILVTGDEGTEPLMKEFVDYANRTFANFHRMYRPYYVNRADAIRYSRTDETGGKKVWGMVDFTGNRLDTSNQIDYQIRFRMNAIPGTDQTRARWEYYPSESLLPYRDSGFFAFQHMIDSFIANKMHGVKVLPKVWLTPMPSPSLKRNPFINGIGNTIPLVLIVAFVYPVSQYAKILIDEKENRVKYAMMIMGLRPNVFYLSWIVTFLIIDVPVSLVCGALVKGVFTRSDFVMIWLFFLLFTLCCNGIAMFLSVFINSTKLASVVVPFTFIIFSLPGLLLNPNTQKEVSKALEWVPIVPFALAMKTIAQYESGEKGVTWKDFSNPLDAIQLSENFWWLILDVFILFFLTWYLDHVIPSEWGIPHAPWFLFTKQYWFPKAESEALREQEAKKLAEQRADPNHFFNRVRQDDVKTKYGGIIEKDPNYADAPIQVMSVRKEYEGDTRTIAVEDVSMCMHKGCITVLLGPNGAGKTTLINQIVGMAVPTGGDATIFGHSILTEMDYVRTMIGYCPQASILWPKLSVYEHLQIFGKLRGLRGDALEAEITSLLQEVVLVTALESKRDALVETLSGGQKRKLCVAIAFIGSPKLVILDEPTASVDPDAKRHIWDMMSGRAKQCCVLLTTHDMTEAETLGKTIHIMFRGNMHSAGSALYLKNKLGVGYHLSIDVNCSKEKFSEYRKSIEDVVYMYVPEAMRDDLTAERKESVHLLLPFSSVPAFPNLFEALEREKTSLCVAHFGLTVTTMDEVFIKIATKSITEEATTTASKDNEAATDQAFYQKWSSCSPVDDTPGSAARLWLQLRGLTFRRFHVGKRDVRALMYQIVIPAIMFLIAIAFTQINTNQPPAINLSPSMYPNTRTMIDTNNCDDAFVSDFNKVFVDINSTNAALNAVEFSAQLARTSGRAWRERFTAYHCGSATDGNMVFFNRTSYHSQPEGLAAMHRGIMNNGATSRTGVFVRNNPLPLTYKQEKPVQAIISLLLSMFILIGFTFIPGSYVTFVVKEKFIKSRLVLDVSGLNYVMFWLSNYIWDFICFVATALLAIFIFLIFDRKEYIGDGSTFGATFLLFLMYGFTVIPFAYFLSFFIKDVGNAQSTVTALNFLIGFGLVLTVFILEQLDNNKNGEYQRVATGLKWVFQFVPSFCLGQGVLNLAMRDLLASFGVKRSVWHMKVTGYPLVYLAACAPLWWGLVLLFDHPFWARINALRGLTDSDKAQTEPEHEDEDVRAERQVIEANGRPDDVVVVKNLRKVWPAPEASSSTSSGEAPVLGPNVAVRNLSFGVKAQEVFGFLGTNGAGKTTTLSVLSGEFYPTSGTGAINKYDVCTDIAHARASLGYLPQTDALWDLLTVREHLELYASIRGIATSQHDNLIAGLLYQMDLQRYEHYRSNALSGGNKRKLGVAISLIGVPSVVILDEPSAGMDPVARRGLWRAINKTTSRQSVILTTHHLEEVEALAHRVGIMVKGEMKCLGSLNHLKEKFGGGYVLQVKASDEVCATLVETALARYPGASEMLPRSQGRVNVNLPPGTVKLSDTFRWIAEFSQTHPIDTFDVNQTSLEQVFLNVARLNDGTAVESPRNLSFHGPPVPQSP